MSCPNCGYCDKCGRSNRPSGWYPAPYWPYNPWPVHWHSGQVVQSSPNANDQTVVTPVNPNTQSVTGMSTVNWIGSQSLGSTVFNQ